MIKSAELTICTLDDLPVGESICYKTLLRVIGKEGADRWTETIKVPLKDDG